ncbi:unnamed protein product, partial [Polarella glacialis]
MAAVAHELSRGSSGPMSELPIGDDAHLLEDRSAEELPGPSSPGPRADEPEPLSPLSAPAEEELKGSACGSARHSPSRRLSRLLSREVPDPERVSGTPCEVLA